MAVTSYRWLDYRVDDHRILSYGWGELLEMHELYFGKSEEKERVELQRQGIETNHRFLYRKVISKVKDFRAAFNKFIGNENLKNAPTPSKSGSISHSKYLVQKFQK